jgi:hypothetical protein
MTYVYLGPPPGWCFRQYEVRRSGFRYTVVKVGDDNIVRDMYVGKFWRWITAARVAQALMLEYQAGAFVESEEVE